MLEDQFCQKLFWAFQQLVTKLVILLFSGQNNWEGVKHCWVSEVSMSMYLNNQFWLSLI